MRDTPDASSASPQGNRPPSEHNSPRTAISLTVNGVSHRVDVEDRWTLVELLRDHLDLTGTKIGCDRSECGACTVLMDGQAGVCLLSAGGLGRWGRRADGRGPGARRTSVAPAASLHRSQCPPMRVLHARPTHDGHRPAQHGPQAGRGAGANRRWSGNLCRCSNYNAIVEAVVAAGAQQGGAA